jgi:hypothetical protein
MQCGVELKNEFFVPVADVGAEVEQPSIMKNTEDWGEARKRLHIHMRNLLVVKYLVLTKQEGRVKVHLTCCPQALAS